MRVDQLAHGAGLDLHRLPAVRVDELRPDVAGPAKMHALLVAALAEERGRDVADAHHLGDGDAEHALDVIADRWDAAARLAPRHHMS